MRKFSNQSWNLYPGIRSQLWNPFDIMPLVWSSHEMFKFIEIKANSYTKASNTRKLVNDIQQVFVLAFQLCCNLSLIIWIIEEDKSKRHHETKLKSSDLKNGSILDILKTCFVFLFCVFYWRKLLYKQTWCNIVYVGRVY